MRRASATGRSPSTTTWGTLVWLVMTTGMPGVRCACGSTWTPVSSTSAATTGGATASGRRRTRDPPDAPHRPPHRDLVLLAAHKDRSAQRLRDLGADLTDDMYVFCNARRFEPTTPCSPHSVSSRYRNLARRLGIDTHIRALRHNSATEFDGRRG